MARLVIEVITKARDAVRDLGGVEKAAAGISGKLSSVRAPAAAALGGIAIGAFKAVQGASDLNETVSKSQAIFGSQAGAMNTWAGGAAKSMGLSKAAALDAASGFGDMFSQIGFSGKAAADMSRNVVGLSADLGSFNNLPTADVNERIAAAFRGEYDSLQALIPNINAARVESEAMAATGKKTAKELTAQEKATAVLAIVQKDGAKAAGDFERTQGGAANQTKIAQATAQNLAAEFGQKLLPAYVAVLGAANQFLTFLGQNQGAVTGVVAGIAALAAILLVASAASTIYSGAMAAMRIVTVAWNGAMAAMRIVTVAYTAAQWLLNAALTANPIGIIVVAIGLLIAGLVLAWRNSETFRAVVTGAFQAVAKVASAVWSGIKQAAQATWAFITTYVRAQIAVVRAIINGLRAANAAVWNAIRAAAVAAWNRIKSAFVAQANAIKSAFGSIRTKASEILTKIKSLFSPDALVNAGRQLMAGLARGIGERIEAVVARVRAAVAKIKALLPGSPIKDGPLKSWNNGGAGKRLMSLLASGIAAGAPAVERELSDVLSLIASPNVVPNLSLAGVGDIDLTGYGAPRVVQEITVDVRVDRTMSLAEVGRRINEALKAYARAGGR